MKLYHHRKLCIPNEMLAAVVREVHEQKGHPGREKLFMILEEGVHLGDVGKTKDFCKGFVALVPHAR